MGTAGGVLGLAGSAIGLIQGIKGLKSKRQKPKVDKEKLQAVGRVQKPMLSKRKVARKKKAINRKKQMITNAEIMYHQTGSSRKRRRINKDQNRKLKAIQKKLSKI